MNTIHTFGCSYTAYFETSGNTLQFTEYKKYRGGKYPKTWPELLSERLNLNLNNVGKGGSSNYEIFQTFCDNVEKFKEGDVVFIGWSYKERFRLVDFSDGTFVKCTSASDFYPYNISKSTVDELLFNRTHEKWVEEIYSWDKVIRKLCDSLKVKVVIWSFDSTIYKDSLEYDLRQIGAESIRTETQGRVDDNVHYGEQGHKVQCDYFLQLLNNKK